jgi:hypothetical protein
VVFSVNWQVEKVVFVPLLLAKSLLNAFEQHFFGVLVWNVLDHHGSAVVLSTVNLFQVNFEILPVLEFTWGLM